MNDKETVDATIGTLMFIVALFFFLGWLKRRDD